MNISGQRFKKVASQYICETSENIQSDYKCAYEMYNSGTSTLHAKTLAETTYYIGKNFEEQINSGVEYLENDERVAAYERQTNYYFINGQRVAKKQAVAEVSYDVQGKPLIVERNDRNFYLNNHLGSTDVVLDDTGSVDSKVKYYPFGEQREPSEEAFSYNSKELDQGSNNYYYEARYYDAGLRHFTQADVIVPEVYNPQSLNRYSYVHNNPINYKDPTGHKPDDSTFGNIVSSVSNSFLKVYTKIVEAGGGPKTEVQRAAVGVLKVSETAKKAAHIKQAIEDQVSFNNSIEQEIYLSDTTKDGAKILRSIENFAGFFKLGSPGASEQLKNHAITESVMMQGVMANDIVINNENGLDLWDQYTKENGGSGSRAGFRKWQRSKNIK